MKISTKASGFTLLELLITLTIVSIVLGLAIPSMQSMITDSVAERVTSQFAMDLQLARNSAITQQKAVSMRALGGDISNGWEIVVDVDNEVIRRRGALDSRITITSSEGLNSITYNSTGQIVVPGTIVIRTTGCKGEEDKSFTLLPSGQITERSLQCL